MSDEERIKRITKILIESSFDAYTRDELFKEIDNSSINEIKDYIWELYCFMSDVCEILNS